jgi:HSF-type DNA-binding
MRIKQSVNACGTTAATVQPAKNKSGQAEDPVRVSSWYHDYSSFVPTDPESGSEYRPFPRFPEKLFSLLARAGEEGYDHIVSWQPHCRCFIVHKRQAFASQLSVLMPGMRQLKSFQRQLNLWGFTRIVSGRDINGYYHENFLRYRPHRLSHLRWRGNGAHDQGPDNKEPDFYVMPFLAPLVGGVKQGDEEAPARASHEPKNVLQTVFDSLDEEFQGTATTSISWQSPPGGIYLQDRRDRSNVGSFFDSNSSASAKTSGGIFHECFSRRTSSTMPTSSNGTGTAPVPSWTQATGYSNRRISPQSALKCNRRARSQNDVAALDQDLEPRPLPPVTAWQGMVPGTDEPIPVAKHPGFVRTGPHEFCFRTRSGVYETPAQIIL